MFSILIPSYNNLEYLKLCIKSIIENSKPVDLMNVLLNKKGRYGKKFSKKEYDRNQIELKKLLTDFLKKNLSISIQ